MIAGGSSVRTLVLTVDPPSPRMSGAELRNFRNAAAAAELGPVCVASVRPPDGSAFRRMNAWALFLSALRGKAGHAR